MTGRIRYGVVLKGAPYQYSHTENIEVDGSHCGLGWNTQVLSIIADRLRQPQDAWQRHIRSVDPL